ncbi:YhgE/Pip domain-containing protein [Paenibacillus sp. GCM10027627]|uniref:YhgE/Pip domain-containing protein n=1 Tax=unclassified Paenibacillus TaxID=185978 RepID=UPI00362822F7
MKLFKNKLFIASPIIALIVMFIFSLTAYPAAKMKPTDLPIAIVNLDEGAVLPDGQVLKLGDKIAGQIRSSAGAGVNAHASAQTNTQSSGQSNAQDAASAEKGASPVKWIPLASMEEAREGMNEWNYYAAIIIPKDFSIKQASLRSPNPQSAEVEVWINQGLNGTASSMATGMLNGMLISMNHSASTQLIEELTKKGAMLTPQQAAIVANPIVGKVTNINEIGPNAARGNAPITLFQPIWMASIAGAALATLAIGKTLSEGKVGRKEIGLARLSQLLYGIPLALLAGFGMAWLADGMLGLNVPSISDLGLFLSLSVLTFFVMISAVLSWTGIRGIVMFVLLLFFGAPLLALPEPFMNGFYRDWIHSWLPMRFMVDGARDLFFFGEGFSWSGPVAVLTSIGAGSLVVLFLSILKPSKGAAAKQDTKSQAAV